MSTSTTETRLISDAKLAERWSQFTSSLASSGARDIDRALQRIAEESDSKFQPLLGLYAKRLLDQEPSRPATADELLADFATFITQSIAVYEQLSIGFEQRFVNEFSRHSIMRLRPQSFRPGALAMTHSVLDSAIELGQDLNRERVALENSIIELGSAFNDPEGRIILAHDRVHAVGNQLTPIMGFANELRRHDLDINTCREYLLAIQTMIRKTAERNRPSLADNPIELFRRMRPNVSVIKEGETPSFLDKRHPNLIVRALGHLVDNAFKADARHVWIKADYKPSDTFLTIGIADDGVGIPEDILDSLQEGYGGSGWRILREVILKQLGAHYTITSPHQSSEPHGTLVMLFVPVVAQTGDEPNTSRRRKADSGPLSAMSSITPQPMPAVKGGERPASIAPALEAPLSGATSCFSDAPGATILQFRKLT